MTGNNALPPGVTLQPIDGGSNYYCTNGLTEACNAGWDNASYFTIGPWLAPLTTQSAANRWLDLGLNTAFTMTSPSLTTLLSPTNPIWLVDTVNGGSSTVFTPGAYTVGIQTFDEPSTFSQGVSAPLTGTANATQDGRFWWLNNTWNFIYFGGLTGTPAPNTSAHVLSILQSTPNATQRHLDVGTIDAYWMAGMADNGGSPTFGLETTDIYGLGSAATTDQVGRASHYGDMIDRQRAFQAGNFPAPVFSFIENGGPYTQDTAAGNYISPPELNAAIWSSIIHGARGIMFFNHTFGGPDQTDDNFAASYYQTVQSGLTNWGILGGPAQTISIYAQAKATDAAVTALAPVINSPFALGYASVSPAGWHFGQVSTTLTGFDVMAKYCNPCSGGNTAGFYVFAEPRYSQTLTSQTATFTIADTAATLATVVNESRTIVISAGSFTDTFADGNTVHIYQIN